jgi:hypothetical protein
VAGTPPSPRGTVLVGALLGLCCFAYLLALPPTLNGADESYLLSAAKRMLEGEVLYRDVFDFLTPGSFYLYALAYAVGGVSITSARVTTALLNAVSAVCTYALALHVASIGEAVIAGLLVVVLCVPVWNMASHHWIATALGLAAAAVLLATRWRDSSRARPAAAGALAGLLVCSHQNRGVWLIVWLAVAVPLLAVAGRDAARWRRCARELLWTAIGGAAVCFPLLGYAVWRASLAEMLYATHTWVLANYRSYNVGKFPWASYGAFWAGGLQYTSLRLMQATPTLLGIEGVWLLWSLYRNALHLERLLIWLLALSAVAAILYFPDIVHIAFILPFVLVILAGMVFRLRHLVVPAERPVSLAILRLAFAAALVAVSVKGWMNARLAWQQAPVLYESAFGTIAGTDLQAAVLRDLRAALDVDPAAPPHLFAYPTDAWLYLALPAKNPTPFALLRPVYNTPEQIQTAIDQLERDPDATVFLSLLTAPPDDPFVRYLQSRWHVAAGLGPPVLRGGPLYQLYRRNEAG